MEAQHRKDDACDALNGTGCFDADGRDERCHLAEVGTQQKRRQGEKREGRVEQREGKFNRADVGVAEAAALQTERRRLIRRCVGVCG